MSSVITLPIKTANQSLIRLCLKILIEAYSFQARYLFSKPSDQGIYDSSTPSSMIPKLEQERELYRTQMLELLENIHTLKLTSRVPGSETFSHDFAQHLHLLSELIYTALTSHFSLDLV